VSEVDRVVGEDAMDEGYVPWQPAPWQSALVTVLIGPLFGAVAVYFLAKWTDDAGGAGRRHWQVWALTSALYLFAVLIAFVVGAAAGLMAARS
jgi:hypothetical protein